MRILPSVPQAFIHLFEKKYTTPAGSQILIRFDNRGPVVSDHDFINPDRPEWGYVPGKAEEMFSVFMNRIPVVDATNITFPSRGEIDDMYYYRLLSPSIPYLPNGLDDATKQAVIQAFGDLKAHVSKEWENVAWHASSSGLMPKYKPTLADPEKWYDTSRNELWESHAFVAVDMDHAHTVLGGSNAIDYDYSPDRTKPLPAGYLDVSFDYCLVNARRPWYSAAFINDKSWCIPTVPKGQLTTIDREGHLFLMPMGFAMIRNLTIDGNWTANDEGKAINATGMGPFQVTWDPVNKKLYHLGPQIIGWALQRMPDLPPNSHPSTTLEAPQPVSPANGSVFNNYPRTTTLEWTPVSNAASYTVEIDGYDDGLNGWFSDIDMKPWDIVPNRQTTSYTFDFIGGQPGRWRVWAMDASGREGEKSPWREFRYTS